MKKVVCEKCGIRRGRRECIKYNKFICGECCSSTQLNSNCPKSCVHIGKLNTRELNEKIHALIETGIDIRDRKPKESIDMFDRALELDEKNSRSLIEKSITYENIGEINKAIECLENAYSIDCSSSIYINIVSAYKKAGKYDKAIDMLLNMKDRDKNPEAEFLLGECFFLTGQYKNAADCMGRVLENPPAGKFYKNKTKAIFARSCMALKDFDKAAEIAEAIDRDYDDERRDILEGAYFASGRMYELLCLLDSVENIGYKEKFILLQCAQVLKKNTEGSILAIVDDILGADYFPEDSFERTSIIGLKIRLLFKELNMSRAYETFAGYENKLLSMVQSHTDCYEACALAAFFLYSLDKSRSMSIYSEITGMTVDEFMLDELYNAFATMDISPYIKARALAKSIELMRDGRGESFNRTSIAADILYELGEYTQAAVLYKRIINSDKPDTVTMYKMAASLMNQGRFNEALDEFKKILSMTKFIPGAYSGAVRCCLELNFDWAEFFRGIELEKLNFYEIYELSCGMIMREHYDKAGYLLSFIMEKYKGMDIYSRKMVHHSMANVYRSLKDYSSGVQVLKQIPEEFFTGDLLLDLGCLYADTGELEKAREAYEKIEDISLSNLVNFNLGILEMRLRNYQGALENFSASIGRITQVSKGRSTVSSKEYGDILNKLYRNSSICLIEIGKIEEALLYIEKAINISNDERTSEILSLVQEMLLNKDRGIDAGQVNDDIFSDRCMTSWEGFTDGIRQTLDGIIKKVYGIKDNTVTAGESIPDSIADFISHERKIYSKNRDSIERSEGTFQRYVDNMMISFDKKIVLQQEEECAVSLEDSTKVTDASEDSNRLIELGNNMFEEFEYLGSQEKIYASLIPYYKAVKVLSKSMVHPYYKKNMDNLPAPKSLSDFREIGIYCYNIGEEVHYRVDFSYNISCSKYLFEINCHPGLRSSYLDFNRHYMPWGKLAWMVSGIRRKWDVVDDAKSAGIMLLFYAGYKNYLGIEGNFDSREDIIRLAGDLIHLSNERDYYTRGMLNGNYEFDYVNQANEVRELALRCIDGLQKIKKLNID